MKIYASVFATLMLSLSFSASSAELVLTSDGISKKGARGSQSEVIAVDIVSDGNVRGFDFIIPVSEGAKVDTSRCLADLPKGFQGVCKFNGTEVAGIAIATDKTSLPKGIHSVGHVTFGPGALPKGGKIKFHAADVDGNTISSSVAGEIHK
ncbi:hypothetical protein OS187_10350 [Xanthomonadaceae bacterium JHOS43]|nr:hypothetical protein [Xanthomonadaceae bacterium JHOS43]